MSCTLHAEAIEVRGVHGDLLLPTTVHVLGGHVTVLAGDPGHGHTAASLALAGRMQLAGGRIRIDGADDPARQRRVVALVDTPGASEPQRALRLSAVIGEELALAGRSGSRRAVQAFLREHGALELARQRWESCPPVARTSLLATVAAGRPGVQHLVFTCPDRWGGEPEQWLRLAGSWAARGFGVVLQCSFHAATALDVETAVLGELTPPAPLDFRPPTDASELDLT
jgi:hypothetical protein